MDKISKLLRRLEPWQILVAGAAATLAALIVVVFGLGPLALTLLAFAGPAWSSVVSVLVTILGAIAVMLWLPQFFLLTFYQARYEREMEKLVLEFVEGRRNGRPL